MNCNRVLLNNATITIFSKPNYYQSAQILKPDKVLGCPASPLTAVRTNFHLVQLGKQLQASRGTQLSNTTRCIQQQADETAHEAASWEPTGPQRATDQSCWRQEAIPLVPQMTNKEGTALTFSRSSPPRCTLGFYSDAPTKAVDC